MLDGTDAGALPQFRTPSDRPPAHADELDESEVIETVERPPVSIRRITTPPRALTPPRGFARPARITRDGPPPITAEVEAQDILLEAYVEAPASARAPRSRAPLPSANEGPPSTRRPTLPPPNPPAMRHSTSSEVRPSTAKPWTPAPPRGSASSIRSASAVRPLAPRAPLERHSTIPGLAPVTAGAAPSPKSVRPASPPLPPKDHVEVISFSSLATTSDRGKSEGAEPGAQTEPARAPSPLQGAAPASPITRPMLPVASVAERTPGDLPPTSRRPLSMPAIGGSYGPLLENTPSIAPVAMATSLALASRAADPTMQLRRQPRRSTGVVAGLALVVAAVLAGAIVAIVAIVQGGIAGRPTAFFERLRGHDEAAAAAPSMPSEASVDPPPAAPAPLTAAPAAADIAPAPADIAPAAAPADVAPAAAPADIAPAPAAPVAVATPSVPVDALPKPNIDPGFTLVTLPRSSKGHRIFVDGRVVGTGPAPMTIKCGTHKVKIGSAGKPRVVELPCGGEIALD